MASPASDFAGLTFGGGLFATNFVGPAVASDSQEQPAQQQPMEQNQAPPQQQPPQLPFAQQPPTMQQPPQQQQPMQAYDAPLPANGPWGLTFATHQAQMPGIMASAPTADDPWGLVSAAHQAPAPALMMTHTARLPFPQMQQSLQPAAAAAPSAVLQQPREAPVAMVPFAAPPASASPQVPSVPFLQTQEAPVATVPGPTSAPLPGPPITIAASMAPAAVDPLLHTNNKSDPFATGNSSPLMSQADTIATRFPTSSAVTDSPPGPQPAVPAHDDDDFWSQMGFALQDAEVGTPECTQANEAKSADETFKEKAKRRGSSLRASIIPIPNQVMAALAEEDTGADRLRCGLPSGKEYEAEIEIYSARLGAVFQTAKEVEKNLYSKISTEVIKALGERPVVAYMAADAGAVKAGMVMGDIVLKINDVEVADPKQAHELVQKLPRPLTLKMLKPDLPIVLGENQHMVKYDNNKPRAPTKVEGWKAKYLVVGGIISEPHILTMYSSKYEYDRAVSSRLAGKFPNSVKVKKLDLRGCRTISGNHVQYDGFKMWHYFMILPPETPGAVKPNIIKISHPMKEGLIPVFEGVKRIVNDPKMKSRPRTQVRPVGTQSINQSRAAWGAVHF